MSVWTVCEISLPRPLGNYEMEKNLNLVNSSTLRKNDRLPERGFLQLHSHLPLLSSDGFLHKSARLAGTPRSDSRTLENLLSQMCSRCTLPPECILPKNQTKCITVNCA
jgi:hypothetical protein